MQRSPSGLWRSESLPKEKTDDSLKEIQEKVETWRNNYGTDYVAHAIWDDNVELTLKCGRVRPVECRLREDLKVSYEKGACYGQRGISDIHIITDLLKKNPAKMPPPCLRFRNRIQLLKAEDLGIISEEQSIKILNDVKSQRESKNSSPLSVEVIYKDNSKHEHPIYFNLESNPTFTNIYIENIPFVEKLDSNPYRAQVSSLQREHSIPDNLVEIAADMEDKENAVDNQLATVLKKWSQIIDPTKVYSMLRELRTYKIPASKIDPQIRTYYRKIGWAYGSVVVLRGKTKEILADPNSELKPGSEAPLLEPFANNGKFFVLDLANKDTLVIGPRKILSGYQEHAKKKGFQLFYIEDMSKDQLDFFKVPAELRPTEDNKNKLPGNTS